MENKLDLLTKKLYEEGVEKANREAERVTGEAQQQAEKLLADARAEADAIRKRAEAEAEDLKRKAEAEMAAGTRLAVAALKQELAGLVAGKVAGGLAATAFDERAFVQEMMLEVVRKWDVAAGSLDLEVVLSDGEREAFRGYVERKCKELLDKGLEIKGGGAEGRFVVRPKGEGYEVAFSEELFRDFFSRYVKELVKKLLYQE